MFLGKEWGISGNIPDLRWNVLTVRGSPWGRANTLFHWRKWRKDNRLARLHCFAFRRVSEKPCLGRLSPQTHAVTQLTSIATNLIRNTNTLLGQLFGYLPCRDPPNTPLGPLVAPRLTQAPTYTCVSKPTSPNFQCEI